MSGTCSVAVSKRTFHKDCRLLQVASGPFLRSRQLFEVWLTPRSRALLEKLTGSQLVKKFPIFYGTWRFIYRVHKSPLLVPILSQINPLHAPYPTYWKSILILSSNQLLGLSSGLPLPCLPTKILYAPLLSPILATCPAHLIPLKHEINVNTL